MSYPQVLAWHELIRPPELADKAMHFSRHVDDTLLAVALNEGTEVARLPELSRAVVSVMSVVIVRELINEVVDKHGQDQVLAMDDSDFQHEMLAVLHKQVGDNPRQSDWLRALTSRVHEDLAGLVERLERAAPTTLPDTLRFQADRIHSATVHALSRSDQWEPTDGFARALQVSYGTQFRASIGYRTEGDLWESLRTRGPVAVKAHYALWARCFEQTSGDPDRYVKLSIADLCRDLGYKRHHKGGYRREHKLEVLRLMETLLPVELEVRYRKPGSRKDSRLHGPIWQRGMIAEERDEYDDLFGMNREGDPRLWDPVSISYRPGMWFQDPGWRKFNEYIGKVATGLLKLDNRNDRWAILVGGYYASLARWDNYEPTRLAVSQILHQTGVARRNRRNPSEQQEDLERAHDRLVQVGVLSHWDYVGRALDWRQQELELVWPNYTRAPTHHSVVSPEPPWPGRRGRSKPSPRFDGGAGRGAAALPCH